MPVSSPLSQLLLKRTPSPSPFLARRILTASSSASSSLLPARLPPSSCPLSTRSYAIIEPITRPPPKPTTPTPTSPASPTPPSSSSPVPAAASTTTTTETMFEFKPQYPTDPNIPKRKRGAWDRYLARGLPEWMIAFVFLFWTYQNYQEELIAFVSGPSSDKNGKAVKMEQATAARDAFLAELEKEVKEKKGNNKGKEVSFLPGEEIGRFGGDGDGEVKKGEGEGEKKTEGGEGGKAWYRRLI